MSGERGVTMTGKFRTDAELAGPYKYDDPRETFSKNLKAHMEVSGETRRSLEAKTGFAYTTITEWLKGNSYPPPEKIQVLANVLGIHKSQLTDIKDNSRLEGDRDASVPVTEDYKHKQELMRILPTLTDDSLNNLLKIAELLPKKDK